MQIYNSVLSTGQVCICCLASITIGLLKSDDCTMMVFFIKDICISLNFSDKCLYNVFAILWDKIVDSSVKQSKITSTKLTAGFILEYHLLGISSKRDCKSAAGS